LKTLILFFLALGLAAAAPVPDSASPLGLGELPPQVLPKNSCALFLWERSTRHRVVMAVAQPATVKVMRGGAAITLAQIDGDGAAVLGFKPRASYGGGSLRIGLDLAIVASEGGGAVIHEGVVSVTGADGGAVVSPVAGLIGCN
jgi:hypothetical protein